MIVAQRCPDAHIIDVVLKSEIIKHEQKNVDHDIFERPKKDKLHLFKLFLDKYFPILNAYLTV